MLFIICFLILSCSRKICTQAVERNKEQYQTYLKSISNYEEGKKSILVDNYRNAINYLSLVTGINSKADYSSTVGYKSKADYKSDMRQWKLWYKKNSCKLTEQYIDSAFRSVGLNNHEND